MIFDAGRSHHLAKLPHNTSCATAHETNKSKTKHKGKSVSHLVLVHATQGCSVHGANRKVRGFDLPHLNTKPTRHSNVAAFAGMIWCRRS